MKKEKSWFRRHWFLSGVIGFFLFFVIVGMFQDTESVSKSDNIQNMINDGRLPSSYESAKSEAVSVSYEDLMRYSETYENKLVCFKGGIIQVVSDIPNIELRVATKPTAWIGYLEEIIYVSANDYFGERLLEDDIIEFCGISKGVVSYEAVLGNKITIPHIETNHVYVKRVN